jgi:hypothetical protein
MVDCSVLNVHRFSKTGDGFEFKRERSGAPRGQSGRHCTNPKFEPVPDFAGSNSVMAIVG